MQLCPPACSLSSSVVKVAVLTPKTCQGKAGKDRLSLLASFRQEAKSALRKQCTIVYRTAPHIIIMYFLGQPLDCQMKNTVFQLPW